MVIAHALTPYLFAGLFGMAYLRRIAGNFGRQPWRPVRTGIRLALLSLALVGLLFAAVFVPGAALAVGIGLAIGAILAGLALHHNHADIVDGQPGYTPNPWIGGALSLLLVGRLLWRYAHVDMATMTSGPAGFGQQASPLTLGIAGTLVAFYVVNCTGLFVQMRRLTATQQRPIIDR